MPERGKQDVGGCMVEMAGNYQFLSLTCPNHFIKCNNYYIVLALINTNIKILFLYL